MTSHSKCGCNTKYGPVKTRTRAQEKVTADYGGDWYEIKDVVRMTIVAPDLAKMEKADKYIREVCKPKEKRGLIKISEVKAEESPCGYSGLNFVAVLENGRAGEIQVNVPGIMYGQMTAATFKEVVGEAKSKELEKAYGIEGGLGHILYELHRVKPEDPNSKKAAELSKEYFAHLRGKPPKPEVAKALQVKIDAFKKEFAKAIAALKH